MPTSIPLATPLIAHHLMRLGHQMVSGEVMRVGSNGETNVGGSRHSRGMNKSTRTARLDSSGYVRRARRTADLSQRELAAALGVHQSRISRVEAGRAVTLSMFEEILATAGLRIVIVDEAGAEVEPMPTDVLRDRAGRRQPSHLDVHALPERPIYRLLFRGVDTPGRPVWYHRRRDRDLLRAATGAEPPEQPTLSSLAADRARRESERRARGAASAHNRIDELFRRFGPGSDCSMSPLTP